MINPSWEQKYQAVTQQALPKIMSDHKPLLLDVGGSSWGPSLFRFEAMWLLHDGFDALVENWWNNFRFHGSPSKIFWLKQKALKEELKKWNKEVFGRVDQRLKEIMVLIEALETTEDMVGLDTQQQDQILSLKEECHRLSLMEETSERQKSRINWLKVGDENSKFFHGFANSRQRHNNISSIRLQGILTTDMAMIKQGAVTFYEQLYSEEEKWRPRLDNVVFPHISRAESNLMERDISESEVVAAIKQLAKEKSPGPDGFPLLFFSHFWELIKFDFMALVTDFYSRSRLDWRCNTTFIFLLPKKDQV